MNTGAKQIIVRYLSTFKYFLTHLIAVFPVPLVEQMHVVAHLHQRLPQQLQLGRVDLRWYWTIAVP